MERITKFQKMIIDLPVEESKKLLEEFIEILSDEKNLVMDPNDVHPNPRSHLITSFDAALQNVFKLFFHFEYLMKILNYKDEAEYRTRFFNKIMNSCFYQPTSETSSDEFETYVVYTSKFNDNGNKKMLTLE